MNISSYCSMRSEISLTFLRRHLESKSGCYLLPIYHSFKMVMYCSLMTRIVALLEELGYQSVAHLNVESNLFLWDSHGGGPTIDLSERHAAYAAGLGTFGLNSDLITPKGLAVQCGSVITDLVVPPTPRIYDNHYSNCLYYWNGSCQCCVCRCPSGAINE